eukprot:1146468-Pelagomonas_calceolata.AAC.2
MPVQACASLELGREKTGKCKCQKWLHFTMLYKCPKEGCKVGKPRAGPEFKAYTAGLLINA